MRAKNERLNATSMKLAAYTHRTSLAIQPYKQKNLRYVRCKTVVSQKL